jgi:hypothetical protein
MSDETACKSHPVRVKQYLGCRIQCCMIMNCDMARIKTDTVRTDQSEQESPAMLATCLSDERAGSR